MMKDEAPVMQGRRRLLAGSIATAFAYFTGLESAIAAQESSKPVNIAIVGSGSAGISIANRLAKALPNAKLTIIDKKVDHYYWPGLTLVATGLWSKADVLPGKNTDFLPSGANINLVKEMVTSYNPEQNELTTEIGRAHV